MTIIVVIFPAILGYIVGIIVFLFLSMRIVVNENTLYQNKNNEDTSKNINTLDHNHLVILSRLNTVEKQIKKLQGDESKDKQRPNHKG